jgi:hypothetical protein
MPNTNKVSVIGKIVDVHMWKNGKGGFIKVCTKDGKVTNYIDFKCFNLKALKHCKVGALCEILGYISIDKERSPKQYLVATYVKVWNRGEKNEEWSNSPKVEN